MASDVHIKFDGITGEATHKDHAGEIEVLSWTCGAHNPSAVAGGGSGKGKVDMQMLTFSHTYDKASPVLAKKCAMGTHFGEVVLTCRKSGEGQQVFLVVTMKEVFINNVNHSGGSSGDLIETVSLSYGDIEYAYKAQQEGGDMGGDVKFGYNVKTTESR